jgi:uncharacterized membrane protein YdbT with pleckstrin-like domain
VLKLSKGPQPPETALTDGIMMIATGNDPTTKKKNWKQLNICSNMKTQLKKDEELILQTQPHWLTLTGPALVTLIVVTVGLAKGGAGILIALLCIWNFIYQMLKRNNNLWAVTNLRVINESGVFSSNSKESPLDKINAISYRQSYWGKICGYGNVQIQTADEILSTTYYAVEKPKELKDTIMHMQEEYKSHPVKKQANELKCAMMPGQKSNKVDVVAQLKKLYKLKRKRIFPS